MHMPWTVFWKNAWAQGLDSCKYSLVWRQELVGRKMNCQLENGKNKAVRASKRPAECGTTLKVRLHRGITAGPMLSTAAFPEITQARRVFQQMLLGFGLPPPCRGSAMMGRQIRTSQNRKHSLCSFSELPAGSRTFYIVLGETVQSQELWSTRIGCPWCLWDIHSWRFSEHIWQGSE